eukprot:CAMPEP_0180694332 /NCGR_PEP_ID=MMETSP1038_2-20121128/1849_1 /TAXON_ID=632150 /ORGANISM="Azadinium spinosum, Strain 3D9" /LENGTH=413 /DNA_ID=CAMNT_0022725657 /DNA_START=24 /DNA_END=1261 /DNA_ORIENTATION=+
MTAWLSAGLVAFAMSAEVIELSVDERREECDAMLRHGETTRGLACHEVFYRQHRSAFSETSPDIAWMSPATNLVMLRHHAQALQALKAEHLLPSIFARAPALYRSVLASAEAHFRQAALESEHRLLGAEGLLRGDELELWKATNGRCLFWDEEAAQRQVGGVLSERLKETSPEPGGCTLRVMVPAANEAQAVVGISSGRADRTIEAAYFARGRGPPWADVKPGWVVVDNALQQPALEALWRFLRRSTIWHNHAWYSDFVHTNLHNGLASPLLGQLAEEIRQRFPGIFGPAETLRRAAAFSYPSEEGSDRKGNGIHLDGGVVQAVLWPATPNQSVASAWRDLGGLSLFNRVCTKGYEPGLLNGSLVRSSSPRVEVSYSPNRLVLFDGRRFHKTQHVNFPSGYRNRRLALNLIFG